MNLPDLLEGTGLTAHELLEALGREARSGEHHAVDASTVNMVIDARDLSLCLDLIRCRQTGWMNAVTTAKRVSRSLDPARRAGLDEYLDREEATIEALRFLLQGRDHLAIAIGNVEMQSPDEELYEAVMSSWEARPVEVVAPDDHSPTDGWDRLLAALTVHEFTAAGRSAPAWATSRLDHAAPGIFRPVDFDSDSRSRRRAWKWQPAEWLRVYGIELARADLETAIYATRRHRGPS